LLDHLPVGAVRDEGSEVYWALTTAVAAPSMVWEPVVAMVTALALPSVFFTMTALPELPTAVGRVTVKGAVAALASTKSPSAAV